MLLEVNNLRFYCVRANTYVIIAEGLSSRRSLGWLCEANYGSKRISAQMIRSLALLLKRISTFETKQKLAYCAFSRCCKTHLKSKVKIQFWSEFKFFQIRTRRVFSSLLRPPCPCLSILSSTGMYLLKL